MTVSYEQEDAPDGTLKINISLTRLEADAVGDDARLMAEIFDSCLWVIAMLRTGVNSRDHGDPPARQNDWAVAFRDFDRLVSRIQGAREGAIRSYVAEGGSLAFLARLMNEDISDVERRCEELSRGPLTPWERWASKYPVA